MVTKLRSINDTDYHHLWLDPRVIESDYPVHILVRLEYTDHWGDKRECKYHVSILAVSPPWPSRDKLQAYLDTLGMSLDEFSKYPLEGQLEILVECGLYAPLFQHGGNNIRKLMKRIRYECDIMQITFGFMMDKPVNAIGDTGWDWIKGDICAGVRRYNHV